MSAPRSATDPSPTNRSTTEVADRYRKLAARFTEIVDAVPDDCWDRQTPCSEWTAIDVVRHVAETTADHIDRMPFGAADPTKPAIERVEPRQAWTIVRDRVQRALDDPATAGAEYDGYFGRTTFAATIDQFYAGDLLVHGWDIARATGLTDHEAMPAEEIKATKDALEPLGDNLRQPGVFGPPVEVAADADPQSKLLAFMGRQP